MDIKIKCDKTSQPFLLSILVQAGYAYQNGYDGSRDSNVNSLTEKYSGWEYILLEERLRAANRLNFCSHSWKSRGMMEYEWPKNAPEIVDLLAGGFPKSPVTMQLTDDYSAKVSKDGIDVGCQHITWDKLDELVKITKDFR